MSPDGRPGVGRDRPGPTNGAVAAQRRRMDIGRLGEDLAKQFLEERGVAIVGRNVRIGRGEIDIHGLVAGRSVAFEVKTIVAVEAHEDAVYRLGRAKAETVRRYAGALRPPAYRVDLVAVTIRRSGPDLRWVPYAG